MRSFFTWHKVDGENLRGDKSNSLLHEKKKFKISAIHKIFVINKEKVSLRGNGLGFRISMATYPLVFGRGLRR